MGISLKDLGNFAIGAIKEDERSTNQRLLERKEELKANRALLIAQKQKKYDRELEEYYKEKEKFDTINKANEMYNAKAIDARTYAATILPITNPNWKNLDDKTKQSNIAGFDGKTVDYKLVGNEEEITKQAAINNEAVLKATSQAIRDAKGDSFLINKILGDRKQAEVNLLQEVEDKIKAAEAIKMTEKNVNQEYVGKDVNVAGSNGLYGNLDRTSDIYKFFRNKNFDKSDKLAQLSYSYTDKNNNLTIAKVAKELNISNFKDYFTYDNDNNITSFKEGGAEFAKTTYSAFKQYKDYLGTGNSTDALFVLYNGDANKLVKHYDKGNLDGSLGNRIKNLGVAVTNGAVVGEGGDFSNILRKETNIIIVPTGNTIDFNNTIIGTNKIIPKDKQNKIAREYADILIGMASQKVNGKEEVNIQKLKEINNELQNLEYGENNQTLNIVNNILISKLIDKNIITKEEALQNQVFNYSYKNSKEFKNSIDILGGAKSENNIPSVDKKQSMGSVSSIEIINPTTGTKRIFPDTPQRRAALKKANTPFNVISSTSAQSNISNEFDDFGNAPFIPQRTIGEMSMEERRLFDAQEREDRKLEIAKQREAFNKTINAFNKSKNEPVQ